MKRGSYMSNDKRLLFIGEHFDDLFAFNLKMKEIIVKKKFEHSLKFFLDEGLIHNEATLNLANKFVDFVICEKKSAKKAKQLDMFVKKINASKNKKEYVALIKNLCEFMYVNGTEKTQKQIVEFSTNYHKNFASKTIEMIAQNPENDYLEL